MGKCCFCGKIVSSSNEFTRRLNGRSCIMCENCAVSFDGIISEDKSRKNAAQKWVEQVKSNNLIGQEIINNLNAYIYNVNNPANNEKQQRSESENDEIYSTNNSGILENFNRNTSSTFWINVLRIIAAITVAVCFVAGAVIGYMVFDDFGGAIVGIIIGLVLGIVSVSVLMVFSGIAEDIKTIANKP